jgi:hypothetical protein
VLVDLGEVGVLQIGVQLALGQLAFAARLGDVRQVRVLGQRVAQRLGDEDLPRGVRQVLLGADDVGDAEGVVVDDAGQVVQEATVGALDGVVGLLGPLELDISADDVADHQRPLAGDLQLHGGGAPLGLEAGPSSGVVAMKRRS